MRRTILTSGVACLLFLAGCSSAPAPLASARPKEHATVTKRDGTVITGLIMANSAAGITLQGSDGANQVIASDQIRTIEYEDHSAPHGGDPGGD